MNALLTTIVLWLSLNFDLPANYEPPNIEFTDVKQIAAMRYPGFLKENAGAGQADDTAFSIVAVYDIPKRTIYLPQGWTGKTPAESSVLVHEMVHHLQNIGGLTFACHQEREKLAYQAQEKWLKMMGRNLEQEFGIDRFTLLAVSMCM